METNAEPDYIYRTSYTELGWHVSETLLDVAVFDAHADVMITLNVRAVSSEQKTLKLFGENIDLKEILVDGDVLPATGYELKGAELSIFNLPQACRLTISSRCNPYTNTALEGLYASGDMLCTQCEPEGFRRIAFYPDRPDVMSVFTTRIEADKSFPQLLSNGNLTETGEAGEGRHYAIWHDPHPKPSYLFALVAGDLECVADQFITASGRQVDLHIYVEHGNGHLTSHAMESLKASMKWDEDVYGLEYDLDLFQIVAVSHFNMGAMENKGLNIFNSKFVLADAHTATDDDLARVESIIAHEYFHNWTGNRVTCRDWFQLTLKEGLTVFRDQCFSADMHDAGVKRAEDVKMLRTIQFSEDASPTAHPIRPERYAEINNFYTPTIYEKGAEVIRMMHTVLGPDAYRQGIDTYFARHDGQAVTCDDFISALDSVSADDIGAFSVWYQQAGTPHLHITRPRPGILRLRQSLPETKANTSTHPMPVPVRLAFITQDGNEALFSLDGGQDATEHLVMLTTSEQEISYHSDTDDLTQATPSYLRHFSAPVRLYDDLTLDEIAHLCCFDTDKVNRGEAFQKLYHKALTENGHDEVESALISAVQTLLADSSVSDQFKAMCLEFPSQSELEQSAHPVNPIWLFQRRLGLAQMLGDACATWISSFVQASDNQQNPGSRALLQKALFLGVQAGLEDVIAQAGVLADHDNMTVSMAALRALNMTNHPERAEALERFGNRWSEDKLVMEKWFALHASSPYLNGIDGLSKLMCHPQYDPKNPNKIRSVLGSFVAANVMHFHNETGAGYAFIAEQLAGLDKQNPQIAARLALGLTRFSQYHPERQALMCKALHTLHAQNLSKDLNEVVSAGLNQS